MRHISLGISILLLTTGVGCVLTDPTDPYAEVNTSHRPMQPRNTSNVTDVDALPSPLTLEDAVGVALRNNPALTAEKRDIAAAKARENAAVARRWPDIRAGGGYTRHVNEQPLTAVTGNVQNKTFTDDLSEAQVSMEMPVFTGGRISNQINAAKLTRNASAHTLTRARRELIFNVSRVYFDILAQERVVKSAKFSKRALKEHLKQVERRIENQKATKVERLRTEVRLANVQEELARARNILEVKRHTLAKLLGMEDKTVVPELENKLAFEDKSLEPLDSLLPEAYEKREDYLAARKKLEAQAKKVDAARAELSPSVALESAYGDRWDGASLGEAEDYGKFGVMLSVPIFEGGRLRAEIKEEKAKLDAARQRLEEQKLQIRLQVQTARSNVSSARERVEATQKAVNQGEESLRIERMKYRVGEATVTDVLDAQADLLESQTKYHQALADYNIALAELKFAIGEDPARQ